MSDQTESIHYYSKRRLPLNAIWQCLLEGASLRQIARRYHVSPPTIQGAVLRLGRQAMAGQALLLASLQPVDHLVVDGLRSCVSSQDYPCDITAVVEAQGETILSMTHTVMRRGGTRTPVQRSRMQRKERVWHPCRGSYREAMSLLFREIWDYLRPLDHDGGAIILTDEHPLYRAVLRVDPIAAHFRDCRLLHHRRISATAPRTPDNPLFPVNYVDRLLRHRLREHTRETIAIGRNVTVQMHRAWIFAFDHNCMREHRVRRPWEGTHAEQAATSAPTVARLKRNFFTRRVQLQGVTLPESIAAVWRAELHGPPLRWRVKQRGSSVRVPAYARRDLEDDNQHAA